ncbi:MAG: 50S ribosomal protein L9 [Pseudomonadota bacterium]|nr:50S ribosomal protein L9 [Pseudomonadota bacterium]
MDVILLERIEKLGQMGDVVTVKPGYARNYLLPQKKALRATESNRSAFDSQRAQLEANNLQNREEANQIAKEMDGLHVVIVRQASDSDQLYGSVTTRNVADAITTTGITAERGQIIMKRPIKTVGMHVIRVNLHPEVSVEIIANVARSEEEAEMQARGERVNQDGEIVGTDPDAVDIETVFEDGAAPEARELTVSDDEADENVVIISDEATTGDEKPQKDDD